MLVKPLVKLLERPNSKIVDATLSILGGLVMEPAPRKQVAIALISYRIIA